MYRQTAAPASNGAMRGGPDEVLDNRPITEGIRNKELWTFCMQELALRNHDIGDILAEAIARNLTFFAPMAGAPRPSACDQLAFVSRRRAALRGARHSPSRLGVFVLG
jgi:hypothetical protein